MANSKVELADGTVLIDLTSDTVAAGNLYSGYTAHGADGSAITGTYVPSLPLDTHDGYWDDDAVGWTRPLTWPDLDSVSLTNFEGLYLTYDMDKAPGYAYIGVYATTNSGSWIVERGHLENGTFVSEASYTQASATYFRQALDSENGTIQLWRITPATGHIKRFVFIGSNATTANCVSTLTQPCVERVGRLPEATDIHGTAGVTAHATNGYWGTSWLEHDKVADITKNTTLAASYYGCYSLRKLEFPGWQTSSVTTLANAFYDCRNLKSLDIGGWDVAKVTSLAQTFYNCRCLKSLNLNSWNTAKVTTLGSTFYYCISLETLNISNWNVAAVTSLSGTFIACNSLKELNIKNWAISTKCTTMASTFSCCIQIRELDLNSWNVSKVTSFANTFAYCRNLQVLNIKDWDFSSATTMAYMFNSNYFLTEIVGIENWRPSNVTNLTYCWANCYSLRSLDLSDWALTKITTVSYAWVSCQALKTLKINTWRPEGAVNISYAWQYCYSLLEIDISSWGGVSASSMEYAIYQTFSLRSANFSGISDNTQSGNYMRYFASSAICQLTYLNMDGIDMPEITNAAGMYNGASLIDFWPPILYVNYTVSGCYRLTRASVLRILAALPTVSETKTVTIGQTNKLKVTAEEIAVATQKGWTVA